MAREVSALARGQRWRVQRGDAQRVLPKLRAGSVDALVTDPPAGISILGAGWDNPRGGRDLWIRWLSSVLIECVRVLKPGGLGWVWSLPRTSHWTGMAIELAGFEVRDTLDHIFATGLPKSRGMLKPAKEVWWLVRTPGELRPLGIEASRIDVSRNASSDRLTAGGRWPANLALSHSAGCMRNDARLTWTCPGHCPIRILDEQSGLKSGSRRRSKGSGLGYGGGSSSPRGAAGYDHSGGASGFFYCAKPAQAERAAGLRGKNPHPTVKSVELLKHLVGLIAEPGDLVLDPFAGSGSVGIAALARGCRFLGIEHEQQFAIVARQRMKYWERRLPHVS